MKRLARVSASPTAVPELRFQGQIVALALLDRSIRFGHHRLAIQRLGAAVELEAQVNAANWAYCEGVARQSADGLLKTRLEEIKRLAARRGTLDEEPQAVFPESM